MLISALASAPQLLKVLAVLAAILVCNALIKNLLLSILAGSLLLSIWLGHSVGAAASIAWAAVSSADNLLLVAVFFLIIWLSTLMARTGVMQDLVSTVQARVSHRLSFAALPAVIGLLPMPGGALFSAPLVDSADADGQLPPGLKARTNFWFRHVWEYCWPLYPGVVLALDLTGMEVWQFVLLQLPVSGLAIGAGALFLLRRIPRERSGPDGAAIASDRGAPGGGTTTRPRSFFVLIAPIITVIGVYSLLRLLPAVAGLNRYVPMGTGLLAALAVLQLQRRPGWAQWRQALLSWRTADLALLVAALRVYAAFIQAPLPAGGTPVEGISLEMARYGLPPAALAVVLPFLSGLALGINVGAVGASFPVVLSLLGPSAGLPALAPAVVLAYACGFAGQLVSPVHVCLVVSNQYFKTSLYRSMLELVAPMLVLTAGVFLYAWALRWLLPLL